MATVSSHILDSVTGQSAEGIRAVLHRIADNTKHLLYDQCANHEGRIVIDIPQDQLLENANYELIFHSADYYHTQYTDDPADLTKRTVVIHFAMPDPDKRYHMPIMLSPHSYSVWWSK